MGVSKLDDDYKLDVFYRLHFHVPMMLRNLFDVFKLDDVYKLDVKYPSISMVIDDHKLQTGTDIFKHINRNLSYI